MEDKLKIRSGGSCELCLDFSELSVYIVSPNSGDDIGDCVYICETCKNQIDGVSEVDVNHWRCLNDSMWSEVEAVKVVSWRMLTNLKNEGWPNDLLDMMYMEDHVLAWAKKGMNDNDLPKHQDSNGVELKSGDSVVLIKDLKVKGGGFTAKRGTSVRNISLVHDNPEHIEGKVEGQKIVILTQYVKK